MENVFRLSKEKYFWLKYVCFDFCFLPYQTPEHAKKMLYAEKKSISFRRSLFPIEKWNMSKVEWNSTNGISCSPATNIHETRQIHRLSACTWWNVQPNRISLWLYPMKCPWRYKIAKQKEKTHHVEALFSVIVKQNVANWI